MICKIGWIFRKVNSWLLKLGCKPFQERRLNRKYGNPKACCEKVAAGGDHVLAAMGKQ